MATQTDERPTNEPEECFFCGYPAAGRMTNYAANYSVREYPDKDTEGVWLCTFCGDSTVHQHARLGLAAPGEVPLAMQLSTGMNQLLDAIGYRAALERIANFDPESDSDEGWNEWGEADGSPGRLSPVPRLREPGGRSRVERQRPERDGDDPQHPRGVLGGVRDPMGVARCGVERRRHLGPPPRRNRPGYSD